MSESAPARAFRQLVRPLPLLRYLVIRTETHAYCGALAFFALIAFYPSCSLLLWLCRTGLGWPPAQAVVLEALREYYPEGQGFLVRNLEVSVEQYGRAMGLRSAFWILLGAAGFFVPLETAFNQLWGAPKHRVYWRNQAIGFLLTTACCFLGLLFVFGTAGAQAAIAAVVPVELLARGLRYLALRGVGLAFAVTAIFLFYRFLPNCPVRSADVFPSALLAGIVTEGARSLYLLVLPQLELQKTQGPYYISISFVLLAYFLSFVLLGGAFLAADRSRAPTVNHPDLGDLSPGERPDEGAPELTVRDPGRSLGL